MFRKAGARQPAQMGLDQMGAPCSREGTEPGLDPVVCNKRSRYPANRPAERYDGVLRRYWAGSKVIRTLSDLSTSAPGARSWWWSTGPTRRGAVSRQWPRCSPEFDQAEVYPTKDKRTAASAGRATGSAASAAARWVGKVHTTNLRRGPILGARLVDIGASSRTIARAGSGCGSAGKAGRGSCHQLLDAEAAQIRKSLPQRPARVSELGARV